MQNTAANPFGIHVVIALIKNSQQEYLIEQRHRPGFQNYWGLPGGKINNNETQQQALYREMSEELSIQVLSHHDCQKSKFITRPDGQGMMVSLWSVDTYKGKVYAKEDQTLSWVHQNKLLNMHLFPITVKLLSDYFV